MPVVNDCSNLSCDIRSACTASGEGRLRCAGYRRETADSDVDTPPNRISNFAVEMLAKWQKGAAEHGPVMPADPLDEAMKEAIDMANYAMETFYRIKALKQKVGGLSQERLRELGIGL